MLALALPKAKKTLYVSDRVPRATSPSARPATDVAGQGCEARLRGLARPRRWSLHTGAEAFTLTVRPINGTLS